MEFALHHLRCRAVALNPSWFRAAMHPILNYVKFRTNHEPNVVHGVVHGEFVGNADLRSVLKSYELWVSKFE